MPTSKYTKKSYATVWILRLIDFIVLFLPLIIEVCLAIGSDKNSTTDKVIVISTTAIALILTLFNFIAQKHLRSPLWIIFLGLYATMEELIPLIILIAIGCIIDEFVLTPLIKWYKGKTVANKAIDQRIATVPEE